MGDTRHRRSERSTLLSVSQNAIAVSHIVDVWHRPSITLVVNARVQCGLIPVRGIAGAMRRKCSLEKSIVTLGATRYTEGLSPLERNAVAEAHWHVRAQESIVAA